MFISYAGDTCSVAVDKGQPAKVQEEMLTADIQLLRAPPLGESSSGAF